jgi:hypothetical protein
MEQSAKAAAQRLRNASLEQINEEIGKLGAGTSEASLLALLENPQLQPVHVRLLLERRDVSATLLERIAARKEWSRDADIRRGLVAHPQTPPWLALKLARDLEITDLLTISFRPSVRAEVRRFADELLLAHIPQLTLGQKLSLARKGPGRIAAELLAGGDARVAHAALGNPYLTEAQLLRALSDEKLRGGAIGAVASHAKWSAITTVRSALVRHPSVTLHQIAPLLARLSEIELDRLSRSPEVPINLRDAIRAESDARSKKQSHLDTPGAHT